MKVSKMISYNKLWKLLIDKNMNKSELRKLVGMSSSSLAKLGKNEPVSMDVIIRICKKLNCDISDKKCKRLNYKFTSILSANLLSYFSTHQFTPNANMPIDIVELLLNDGENDGAVYGEIYGDYDD